MERRNAVRKKILIPKFEAPESSGVFPGLAIQKH